MTLCPVNSLLPKFSPDAEQNAVLFGFVEHIGHAAKMSASRYTDLLRVLPVAVTDSPNLLCCILRYFTDFAFCCCVI